ncbi:MAG TPA: class I SAM-dependent methyltransferase [Puia sp.]|uniref:class I SAM-dependent methyltransferase n=1 Tax=Puia sp. TaxID=2045100 RepID=UPI002B8BFBD6|nr:class I SAM-dependent methyltransferase [Puia sp.]HVU99431.1 class I SAM-dependent methyltransferase [Puia sp.]
MNNSTTRFSDRVEDYVKYRPHYPAAILSHLATIYGFDAGWAVADIGSGTGISTELFLRNGNRVYAVEPNREMRLKAEELLGGYPGFVSVDGTAEATGLPGGVARLIVAGQAFHWFDPVKTRRELVRIGVPGAVTALVWNERMTESDFEKEYEDLISRYAGEYRTVNHRNIDDLAVGAFFAPATVRLDHFDNEQLFDLPGLTGRLLSSSYVPKDNAEMMRALAALFGRHARDGKVRVGYDTKLYTGLL